MVGSKPGVAPTEGLLAVGVQLQGRYKILGVIGVGGMGAVYRAQDLRFLGVTRLCAIKEMVNTATDPRVREMIIRNFEREASILATLSHPAIPQVYDYFTEGSRSYLVLEFVEGQDLEARVSEAEAARRRASGGVGYPVVRSVVVSAQSPAKADHLPRSQAIEYYARCPWAYPPRGLRHRQDLPERRKGHDDRDGGLLTPSSIGV